MYTYNLSFEAAEWIFRRASSPICGFSFLMFYEIYSKPPPYSWWILISNFYFMSEIILEGLTFPGEVRLQLEKLVFYK